MPRITHIASLLGTDCSLGNKIKICNCQEKWLLVLPDFEHIIQLNKRHNSWSCRVLLTIESVCFRPNNKQFLLLLNSLQRQPHPRENIPSQPKSYLGYTNLEELGKLPLVFSATCERFTGCHGARKCQIWNSPLLILPLIQPQIIDEKLELLNASFPHLFTPPTTRHTHPGTHSYHVFFQGWVKIQVLWR